MYSWRGQDMLSADMSDDYLFSLLSEWPWLAWGFLGDSHACPLPASLPLCLLFCYGDTPCDWASTGSHY